MNQLVNNPQIGDKILRLNSNGHWAETEVNYTYLERITEFPEDYRRCQKGKRTGVEFGAHDFTAESCATPNAAISCYLFKIWNSSAYQVRFVNAYGLMTVSGDWGNWVFSREFHPSSKNGGVSDNYWIEKLKTASSQDPYELDEEETRKELESWLDGTHEYFDEERPLTPGEFEYLHDCLYALGDSELQYAHVAHFENVGRFKDHDRVPLVKKPKYALQVIFDAWDCIVERLKETK